MGDASTGFYGCFYASTSASAGANARAKSTTVTSHRSGHHVSLSACHDPGDIAVTERIVAQQASIDQQKQELAGNRAQQEAIRKEQAESYERHRDQVRAEEEAHIVEQNALVRAERKLELDKNRAQQAILEQQTHMQA